MKTSRATLITLLVGVIISIIFAVVAQTIFVANSLYYVALRSDISAAEQNGKENNWTQKSVDTYNESMNNFNTFVETTFTGRLHNFLARFGKTGNFISIVLTLLAALGVYSTIRIIVDEYKEQREIMNYRKKMRNQSYFRAKK